MADAWGGSWGTSWGSSWGIGAAVPTRSGGDGVSGRNSAERRARRERYVRNRHYVIEQPKPLEAKPGEEPRKVTRAVVQAAVAQLPGWFGTIAEAQRAAPIAIPLPDMRPAMERQALVAAVRAYIEQAMRDYEAAEKAADEEDIELLLLAA